MGAWVFSLVALMLGLAALVAAGQAWTRSSDAKDLATAAQGTQVVLQEFSITPSVIAVDTGASLTVKNSGTVAHNLAVKGTSLKTPDIAPGKSETLDVSSLKPGMYTAYCQVPGHEAAGMTAMLHVGIGGAAAAASSAQTREQNDQQDA